MGEALTFLTLGGDVLAIIVILLHSEFPWSLDNLSLVSKFCKELVDPLRYRSIELSDNVNKIAYTKRKIQRLTDPNDSILRHVRELHVTDFTGEDRVFRAGVFKPILGHLFRLQVFSWQSSVSPPRSAISKLEQQWPRAKLIVCKRARTTSDIQLLFAPLLDALTFDILNWKPKPELQGQRSRLPELRDVLLNNVRLRVLDIRTRYCSSQRFSNDQAQLRSMNLPLQSSDRLPPLHELTFSGPEPYEFDLSHVKLWSKCMDWSELRTLDLGLSCPQHFFEEIGSQLIGLKSLTMGMGTGPRSSSPWRNSPWESGPMTCETLEPATQFIVSLPGLHELHITDFDAATETIVPTILETQNSLQALSYHASTNRRLDRRELPCTWTTAQLDELRQIAPDMLRLSIDFPLEGGKWPSSHAAVLVQFSHLRSLTIFVELNSDVSDFAPEQSGNPWGEFPKLDEARGREVASSLFKSFFMNDAYACMADLEVQFIRREVDGGGPSRDRKFPIKIRRLERDDAPRPADGGFSVECEGKWLRQW